MGAGRERGTSDRGFDECTFRASSVMTTLLDKIWRRHIVLTLGEECLLYVDRNFVHEESTQAFEALAGGRRLYRAHNQVAFCDHYAPTRGRERGVAAIPDPEVREMIVQLEMNAARHGLTHFGMDHAQQGIMHVVGPELGLVLPGFIVTGSDSHTCTNGAFGAFAFGIGQSELRQVFMTQTIWRRKPKAMRITVDGVPAPGIAAKDIILNVISTIGPNGAGGYAIEYAGSCIARMSMGERMTICNMSIEAGAQAGMIAPDEKTIAYLESRQPLPRELWTRAVEDWRELRADSHAAYDRELKIDGGTVEPMVTWGTSLEDAAPVHGCVPDPSTIPDSERRTRVERALNYMALAPGTRLSDIDIDLVFIGSCSNARIEDLRSAAEVLKGRCARVPVIVAPGSRTVKRQAEAEGLDEIFRGAGCEWRDAGCSMCVGSNGDLVPPGRRCASTSPRNFEGRQGPGARTHVMSPAMAAAAALTGKITDVRRLLGAF
jgi:3-isopropylmalate/(R)-2-methylmalate dehydratase large subunit